MSLTLVGAFDSKKSNEQDGTQLAAAGMREGDLGATRGAARTPENVVAPGLTSPSDDAQPTTTTTAAPTTTEAPRQEVKREEKKSEETTTEAPKPKATEAPKPKAKPADKGVAGSDSFAKLAKCESGNSNANTGNGYYGYFQFDKRTWQANGGSGVASDHSYETQKAIASKVQSARGWQPWPSCSKKLGL